MQVSISFKDNALIRSWTCGLYVLVTNTILAFHG